MGLIQSYVDMLVGSLVWEAIHHDVLGDGDGPVDSTSFAGNFISIFLRTTSSINKCQYQHGRGDVFVLRKLKLKLKP